MSQSTKTADDLWLVHGKYYDLESFVDEHPGGAEMLLLGKGRDCTELFESVHALCGPRPWEILRKYEALVPAAASPSTSKSSSSNAAPMAASDEMFTWEDQNGFYSVLKQRVKAFVKKDLAGNHHASWHYFLKVSFMLATYAVLFYQALYSTHRALYRIIAGSLAGIILEAVHFCTMHDGLHGGVSKNSAVNMFFGRITNWFFWDGWIWLRHHTYGHHSYTGIFRKDPDLTNSNLFLRKVKEAAWKPMYEAQHIYSWLWMMIAPNQHWGQTLVYSQAMKKRKVFGLPFSDKEVRHREADPLRTAIYLLSFLMHFILPVWLGTCSVGEMLTINFLYWTAIGISYFVVVLPNHDTDDVLETQVAPEFEPIIDPSTGKKIGDRVVKRLDWGEMQVRNSCNHSIDGSFFGLLTTHMYGGMNYQIEHHLFPAMSSEHTHRIAPIVQQTCKEFGIPYNAKKTWWDAVVGYYNLLKVMGKKPADYKKDK